MFKTTSKSSPQELDLMILREIKLLVVVDIACFQPNGCVKWAISHQDLYADRVWSVRKQ